MNSNLISIDLAKNVFQVCVFNQNGKVVSNKKVKRQALRETLQQQPPSTVVMEACYSAHYWGRELEKMGHQVKLIPAQHVKPFVRGNKNDANDAVAIAEASQRPKIRFVPVKTVEQQDIQMIHRVRQRHVEARTALVNQIRGLLSEYGIVVEIGWRKLKAQLPLITEDAENGLSPLAREGMALLYEELVEAGRLVEEDDRRLVAHLQDNEDYQHLLAAPGFGPILSSAAVASIGNGAQFASGRELAAWIGLTPLGVASGDKSTLRGISKRGNRYLRTLFIHGARAIVNWCEKKSDPLNEWIKALMARRGRHKAIVALAHKMARFAWVMLSRKEPYRAPAAVPS